MSTRFKRVLPWYVAAGLLFGSPTVALADARTSDEANLYFSNGVELLQNDPPNYQDAYHQFRRAYEVSKSWKALGNLGLCAFKLERDGEALDHYTEYLKRGGKEIDPGERAALQKEMLLITSNSAVVELSSSEPNVQLLDSRAGSSAPAQAYKLTQDKLTLRLRAGVHTLTATDPRSGRRVTWEVALSPNEELAHTFDFSKPEAPSAAPSPAPSGPGTPNFNQPEAARTTTGGTVRIVGFVTVGVGAAALIGGGVAGMLSSQKEEEAADAARLAGCGAVDGCPKDAPVASLNEDQKSAASLARTANILFIAGGIVAAGGIGMIVFGGPTETTSQGAALQLKITPVVGLGGGGLFASGRF